jgi:polysaccharide export outer membrane protein
MWRRSLVGLLLSVSSLHAQSPRVPAADAIHHVGQQATVCGPIAGRHPIATVPNLPTFIDLGTPFPRPTFTVILWDSDKKTVGDFPTSGNVCVTGTIEQYNGVPLMVLSGPNSWALQAPSPDPPAPPVNAASGPSVPVAASAVSPPVPTAPAPPAPVPTASPRAPSVPPALAVAAPDPSSAPPAPVHRLPATLSVVSPPATSPPTDPPENPSTTPLLDPPDLSAPSSSYRIGADDSLQITVWREPSLSGTFLVRPDGEISLVLVGDVLATGLTPMELADNLTERFHKFIQDPLVSVIVAAPNSQKVYVLGEVQRAGPISMTTTMSPLQAIATAGGLTPYAAQKKIYILRGPEGSQQKIPFNYKSALNARPNTSIQLLAGDTIVVP